MRLAPAFCGALALLILPAAAGAQETTAYDRAVAARLGGDAAGAARLLHAWIADHPGDADAQVQLGYALLALGRLDAAETQFRSALAAAPGYADASAGLAQIEARRAARHERAGFLLLEGAFSHLGAGNRDWKEAGVVFSAPVGRADNLSARATWHERFGIEDLEIEGTYTHRAGADTWLRGGIGITPSADYRPEVSATAGIDRRLSPGGAATVIGADAAWRRYPAQEVFTLSPAITQYLGGDGALSLTARVNALLADGDAVRIGGTLRGDYAPGDRRRAFIGLAAGPDTDLGIVTDTVSLFGGGEVELSSTFSLTGSVAREWRDGPADRTEFRLGLQTGW